MEDLQAHVTLDERHQLLSDLIEGKSFLGLSRTERWRICDIVDALHRETFIIQGLSEETRSLIARGRCAVKLMVEHNVRPSQVGQCAFPYFLFFASYALSIEKES